MRNLRLLFVLLFILSCSKTDDSEESPEKPEVYTENMIACKAEDLGITSDAKRFLNEDEVFFVVDTVWQWYRKNNNIQVQFRYGCGDECSTSRVLNFKLQDSCIVLTQDYSSRGDVFDGSETRFNDIDFELQEFNENRIIGRNMDTEFWVEFEESAELNQPATLPE